MTHNKIFKVEINDNTANPVESKTRESSRILHFSDGDVEVFDEDEEETQKPAENKAVIDPSTLKWGPWFAYKALHSGQKVLSACDYAGETLAYYLGITSPKYQFEIEEYERMKQRKKQEIEQKEKEGWVSNQDLDVHTQQPQQPDPLV